MMTTERRAVRTVCKPEVEHTLRLRHPKLFFQTHINSAFRSEVRDACTYERVGREQRMQLSTSHTLVTCRHRKACAGQHQNVVALLDQVTHILHAATRNQCGLWLQRSRSGMLASIVLTSGSFRRLKKTYTAPSQNGYRSVGSGDVRTSRKEGAEQSRATAHHTWTKCSPTVLQPKQSNMMRVAVVRDAHTTRTDRTVERIEQRLKGDYSGREHQKRCGMRSGSCDK
jgi:hypothetical protein